ncbi:hypothetical protein J8L13_04675 [Bacteroides fragilis]|uniref:hypothetical protein n=1 Tax=Bacteroides fragilis TaxID=817 RepID=UPI00202E72C0|nr:hypothetical protein [Bacteroides fragilis]MCM0236705.1 hypothetical protein [Bacteroides fragilis]
MKTFRKLQKVAIAVGMVYGLWLGCNVDATDKDSISGMVIVALAVIVALSILIPEGRKEEEV